MAHGIHGLDTDPSTARLLAFVFFLLTFDLASAQTTPKPGEVITKSCTVNPAEYRFDGADGLDQPVLIIKGEDIEVDFQGAVFIGSGQKTLPDQFAGLGIRVEGKKITIKNLKVRGYKVGLMAAQCADFQLIDSDFSYNWRPRLHSRREHEVMSDWLSYHQNDRDEWLRYGSGVYLKNCKNALVRGCTATSNQNGLLMTGCDDGQFFNNDFRFNSGIGIGLYRSSGNSVMHNRLNFNVRGFSQNLYERGQDSAGILCFEQSSRNVFAYNSATHSGDGFFGWAGQSTMDTGEGGCNDNIVFGNDFSFGVANGIEMTFSGGNKFWSNNLAQCGYGIWAGYSHGSEFCKNVMRLCKTGIAIEHGQDNRIEGNEFDQDSTGIPALERKMSRPIGPTRRSATLAAETTC